MVDARDATEETKGPGGVSAKRAVPLMLFLFVFSLVIDNGFKNMSLPIAEDLGLSVGTVSLQATLAGILIGIGAVVYSTLADTVSIRRLILAAIIMMTIGSLIGFAGQKSFVIILIGRIIQTAGLAAAETLYVVYVTKYLSKKDQKTYLGFSTSAFQLSMLIGIVGSGFIATYIGWTVMFLIPLVVLLTVPGIIKLVPKDSTPGRGVDVLGPFLIAVLAAGTLMFMQEFNWLWLLPTVAALGLFIWHIRAHPNALVTSEFFQNKSYVFMLVIVFVLYSVNLGVVFLMPFLAADLHGLDVSQASLISAPGLAVAVLVGALSGKIAKFLDSRQAITLAISLIAVALLMSAALAGTWVGIYVIALVLFFAGGFALIYAPLLSTAIADIPPERSGVAIGFYNLTINVASPLGIAYTAAALESRTSFLGALSTAEGAEGGTYATVLYLLGGVALLALVLYRVFAGILERQGYDSRQDFTAE